MYAYNLFYPVISTFEHARCYPLSDEALERRYYVIRSLGGHNQIILTICVLECSIIDYLAHASRSRI